MRVIEKEMLEAIKHGRNWSKANTRVEVESGYRSYVADVYLHGHHIAEVFCRMGCDDTVKVNRETLANWPTVTTKSRLRALGADVYTKKHTTYLDGEAVD